MKQASLDFTGKRKISLSLSFLLLIGSVFFYMTQGLNFGIDFRGGTLIEIRSPEKVDIASLRGKLSNLNLGDVSIQEFGQPTDVLIRIQQQEGGKKAQLEAINSVKKTLGNTVDYRRVEFVGPKIGDELKRAGFLAVSFALIAILFYMWFRFEWQFGLCAIIALAHDILITVGLFSVLNFEFNLSTLAAVLTIAGYSINDTVVVFDRIRENLRKYKKRDLAEVLNLSINETLSRTVVTSLTTLAALFCLYFLGGEVIKGFSFAMIWGVIIGTYSSIFIAAPILMQFNLRKNFGVENTDASSEEV